MNCRRLSIGRAPSTAPRYPRDAVRRTARRARRRRRTDWNALGLPVAGAAVRPEKASGYFAPAIDSQARGQAEP